MNIAAAKKALRVEAKARRQTAHEGGAQGAAESVIVNFMAAVPLPPGAAVGSYWPFETELDAGALLAHLHGLGHPCAVPAVAAADQPLAFRAWAPGDRLTTGRLGEPAPDPRTAEITPDILLVPLLAFDRRGYRLGFGGGYYDRTIAALGRDGEVLAVGLAYAAQEVDEVPHDGHDARLDWVVTEREAISTGN